MDNLIISKRVYRTIYAHVNDLVDFTLSQMGREISEGWRCFYAQEILLSEYLPTPLINEVGRHYMAGDLMCQHYGCFNRYIKRGEPADFSIQDYFNEAKDGDRYERYRDNYRNYLNIKSPPPLPYPLGPKKKHEPYLDLVAKRVIENMIETEHRHLIYESKFLEDAWWLEVIDRAEVANNLPIMIVNDDDFVINPKRTDSLPLIEDQNYWYDYYRDKKAHKWAAVDGIHYTPSDKPALTIDLMQQIAPDFPYAKKLSMADKLVFMQESDEQYAWCIVFDKDGGLSYKKPMLILTSRHLDEKIKNNHYLFVHYDDRIFRLDSQKTKWPYGREIALRHAMPRFRSFINFYHPLLTKNQNQ